MQVMQSNDARNSHRHTARNSESLSLAIRANWRLHDGDAGDRQFLRADTRAPVTWLRADRGRGTGASAGAGRDFLSLEGAITVMQEVGIGILMGFAVQFVFDAITLGGQVIAMSMGLGFAVFLDRARGVSIPVLGQLFLMLGMLVFLSLDGHLALIKLVAESFKLLPIATRGLSGAAVVGLLEWSQQVFIVA